MELARSFHTGAVSINSVFTYLTVPSLPFGGVGDSGFGRIHGADGLKEFTRAKSITRKRFSLPFEAMTFDRDPKLMPRLKKLVKFMHGRR